jgi:hypothetical protein
MGGGGGGGGLTFGEKLRLEQIAKEALTKASGEGKCNVFISFVTEDLHEVNLLRGQAKNDNCDLEFNDWSLREPFDSNKADYIKRGIRERIRQSSVTIVYISEKTAPSKWVDWEIRESIALGKGVIAMHKGERPPSRLPPALVEHRVVAVPWDHKEIMKAIERSQ